MGFSDGFVDLDFSDLILSYFPFQLPMFVVWKGQVANVLIQEVVCFDSCDKF